mgnify:CR=1 FL=1
MVYDNSITNEVANADWQSGGLSVLTLFEGLVYFEITQENQLNVLADFYDRNGVPLNRNVTYGNVLVKTLERKVGEVVTLEITKDAFLREVSSSISKK